MKNRLIIGGILLVILVFIGTIIYYKNSIAKLENENQEVKRELIRQNQLIQIDSTKYEKIVNDLNTERELIAKLKRENEDLYKEVSQYKVLYYGVLETGKVVKIDTVYIEQDSINIGSYNIEDYFPGKVNPFIIYKANISGHTLASQFILNPIKLSYVITEDKFGIKRIVFNTPTWMSLEDVQLEGIKEPEKKEQSKIGISGGAGLLYKKEKITPIYKIRVSKGRFGYEGYAGKEIFGAAVDFRIF